MANRRFFTRVQFDNVLEMRVVYLRSRKGAEMGYIKEPFEELDVMSDFLNNSLATNPDFGEEYCRLLIRNLIGYEAKKINVNAQKYIGPSMPDNSKPVHNIDNQL